ncbi:MAG: hydrolase TatD, partial [Candidatus Aenigmatarchaeota archaeon]
LLMTETDSPWLGLEKKVNTPLSVRLVVQRIAELRKESFEKIDEITTKNAIEFFSLDLKP